MTVIFPRKGVHCCKFPSWQQLNHRMIRLMEGNAKCRHLKKLACKGTLQLVFIGVYRLEIANFLSSLSFGIFTLLWCPSHRFSGSTPPPPPIPYVNKYTACIHVYVGGEGVGFLSLRQINTCRKVPVKVPFFRWRHFAFVSIWLISPWIVPSGPWIANCKEVHAFCSIWINCQHEQGWMLPASQREERLREEKGRVFQAMNSALSKRHQPVRISKIYSKHWCIW